MNNNEIQYIDDSAGEANNQNNEVVEEKKSKGPLIALIIFILFVIAAYFGITYLIDKGYVVIEGKNNNGGTTVKDEINRVEAPTKTYGSWSDYSVAINDVVFDFPIEFKDFKDMIAKTNYKLSKRSTLDKEVPTTYGDDNYVIYEHVIRGSNASIPLSYMLKVNLQNKESTPVKVEDSTVIGFTVEYALIYDEGSGDLPYDKDITFTTHSVSLGDTVTKTQLINTLGKCNVSDELGEDEYEVGKYLASGKEYHNFYALIRNEQIVKIELNNFVK